MKDRLAFYARYSCDQQKETSIDDQLRRCRDVARQYGFDDEHPLVFSDSALSGTAKHHAKRTGYHDLTVAWDAGMITVLIVDEYSRLTRDGVEHAHIVERLENNRRVRLITANGIDTAIANWQLQVGLIGLIGQQATRDTQHRVSRGMVGQLERGYLVATPAFGYSYQRDLDERGNRLGTRWLVHEQEAKLVREIFARRESGQSMHQIAKWLNDAGVPCSRQARTSNGGFWRPSRIRALLSNPVYRGEIHWHGSSTYLDKARKQGIPLDTRVFPHPELRLVSDETWHRCNGKTGSRGRYGGGKHALAGIVTCGCCGGVLAVSASKHVPSLHCPSCSVAKHAGGQGDRLSSTIATVGVEYLLTEAMQLLLTSAFMDAFKAALQQRLAGDDTHALEEARNELGRLTRAQERLSRLIAADDTEDDMLESRYAEVRARVRDAQARVDGLETGRQRIHPDVVKAQMQIDPIEVLATLFKEDVPPHQLRMVLGRLFPAIVFEGKERRYAAIFTLRFAPGVALAEASGTEVIVGEEVVMRYRLTYSPRSHFAPDNQRWSVIRLDVASPVDEVQPGKCKVASAPAASSA